MQARLLSGIADLPAAAWNRLAPPGDPFLSAEYLGAMEASRSAATKTGWQPLHIAVEDAGELVAAAPLYAKGHSWGEYVFDHAWADAYRRAGGSYYPKLQVAVPFTPVPGRRLLAQNRQPATPSSRPCTRRWSSSHLSSLHVTFCTAGRGRGAAQGRLPRPPRRPVPLGEPRLRRLRRLPRVPAQLEEEDGPQGARAGPRLRARAAGARREGPERPDARGLLSPSTSPRSTSAGAAPT